MAQSLHKPYWSDFYSIYAGRQREAFESLARMLFKKKFGVKYSLAYFSNHPGNETCSVKYGEDIIGFQAKCFDNEINVASIKESLSKAAQENPEQTIFIVYCNKTFNKTKETIKEEVNGVIVEKTKTQKSIEDEAEEKGLKIEWILGDNILDLVSEYELAYQIFFNPKSELRDLHDDITLLNEINFRSIKTTLRFCDE